MKKGLIVFNEMNKVNRKIFMNIVKKHNGYLMQGTKGSLKDFIISDEVHNIMLKIEKYIRGNMDGLDLGYENDEDFEAYFHNVQKYVELYLVNEDKLKSELIEVLDNTTLSFIYQTKNKVNNDNYINNKIKQVIYDEDNLFDVVYLVGYKEDSSCFEEFFKVE